LCRHQNYVVNYQQLKRNDEVVLAFDDARLTTHVAEVMDHTFTVYGYPVRFLRSNGRMEFPSKCHELRVLLPKKTK